MGHLSGYSGSVKLVLKTLLVALLLSLISVLPAFGQSAWLSSYLNENNKRFEESVQLQLRDFRLLKTVRNFDERFNDNRPIEIKTEPVGAIATLHDISTGEPLEVCETPCSLHVNQVSEYLLVIYKLSHEPVIFPIAYGDDVGNVWLGADYMEIERKHFTCRLEFMAREKTDSDAEVCLRTPPIMPANAQKSGHCKVAFDVSKEGRPENIKTTYCTEEHFSAPSIQSVHWWFYHPKVERGSAVQRPGVGTTIRYRLTDESGVNIPESGL